MLLMKYGWTCAGQVGRFAELRAIEPLLFHSAERRVSRCERTFIMQRAVAVKPSGRQMRAGGAEALQFDSAQLKVGTPHALFRVVGMLDEEE